MLFLGLAALRAAFALQASAMGRLSPTRLIGDEAEYLSVPREAGSAHWIRVPLHGLVLGRLRRLVPGAGLLAPRH